jgi:hypothetical protein
VTAVIGAPNWAPDIPGTVTPLPSSKHGGELAELIFRPRLLPEEFWAARPVLQHVRRAAHARVRSGDLVLGGLLCRIAALVPPHLQANTGVGSPASLNMFAGLLGPSGSGKSSASHVPKLLLPVPQGLDFLDGVPLGSGEGIAEAYMGERPVETDEVYHSGPKKGEHKTEVVRMQVRHNVLFFADEGESLTKQLFGRLGATVGASIRAAWTGGTIGQQNGQKATTRIIAEGSYSLGIAVGFQPETALPLLDDVATGTPQRFLWVASTDPTIPCDVVDDPGPLSLTLFQHGFGDDARLSFATSILSAIREDDWARSTGNTSLPPLDSHKPLMRVKVASLLAILDDRLDVTQEDWQLSLVVWETSARLRDSLIEYGSRQIAEKEEKRTRAYVDREVRAYKAKTGHERKIERVARRAAVKVHEAEGMTRGDLRMAIAHRDRDVEPAALEFAETRGWITVEGGRVVPGDSRPT